MILLDFLSLHRQIPPALPLFGEEHWVGSSRQQQRHSRHSLPYPQSAVFQLAVDKQYRQAQAVVLPLRGLSLKEAAEALGISPGWVSRLRNRFISGKRVGETASRGGRHHAHFTQEEEAELLRPFLDEAAGGGILVVGQIKAQLETRLQCVLAGSSVYALLHRHGWRQGLRTNDTPK